VPALVDGLIDRLRSEPEAARRRELADLLTRVYKKPGPWTYWGYRPPPRPPNTVAWECSGAIEQALNRVLADPDRTVRLAVLRRMQREKIPAGIDLLGRWLRDECEAERVGAILDSLREHPAGATRELLEAVAAGTAYSVAGRRAALDILAGGLDQASEGRLLTLARSLDDGPVLAEALRYLGRRPALDATSLLLGKLASPEAAVRAAAVEALGLRHEAKAAGPAEKLLRDQDANVRRAAASALGMLGQRRAGPSLLAAARDRDPAVRRASLESLRLLHEPRALPLAVKALSDPDAQLTALRCVGDLGGPAQLEAVLDVAARNPSAEVLSLVVRMLTRWAADDRTRRPELDHGVADLQGRSGALVRWTAAGPRPADAASAIVKRLASPPTDASREAEGETLFAEGTEARVQLGPARGGDPQQTWWAYTDLNVPEQCAVQFLTSSNGTLRIWLNGQVVHQRNEPRGFQPDSERFDAALRKGPNRLLVLVSAAKGGAAFHLRFRRKSSTAEHEKLARAALARPGDAGRGRKLFFDVEKSQCLKCHRLGDQGERIGPELTGVGSRFSRVHIIESILEPSRSIAAGFQTVTVVLKNGRVVSGIRVAEEETTITLGDNQGQKHVLAKRDIEEQQPQPASTMPDGLEKRLTADEFVDLIAFLAGQKQARPR
jgi:putative heme-binding domain-containing protein